MLSARALRAASGALVSVLLALGIMTARAVQEGEAALEASDTAFNRGDVRGAAFHARRAAIWYAPGAPHVDRAYARLLAVAKGAEALGDRETALYAWNAVRGAALETRHAWVPRAGDLEEANRNLARLGSTKPAGPESAVRQTSPAERRSADRERVAQELSAPVTPTPLRSLSLLAGFLLVAAAFAHAAWLGLTPEGRWVRSRLLVSFGLALGGVVVWALGAMLP
jgi:hypothetical protein